MFGLKDPFYASMSDDIKNQLAQENLGETLDNNCEALYLKTEELELKIEELEEENEGLKDRLCELDPDFGDMIHSSDRGYEMKYD